MPKQLPRPAEELTRELVFRVVQSGQTMAAAASALGIAEPTAYKLKRKAEEDKVYRTEVVFLQQMTAESELENLTREYWREYGVTDVRVLPTPADDRRLNRPEFRAAIDVLLGREAATYINGLHLPRGSHLAVSGGAAIYEFARRFTPRQPRLVVRPLMSRGYWRPATFTTDPGAVLHLLEERLGARGLSTLYPHVLPGPVPASDWTRAEVRAVFSADAPAPAVCITSIGGLSEKPPTSRKTTIVDTYVRLLAEQRYFEANGSTLQDDPRGTYSVSPSGFDYSAAWKELRQAGCAASLNWYALTETGVVLDRDKYGFLDRTSVGVHPENVLREWITKHKTLSIGVAHGSGWARALSAAMIGRFLTAIVVDAALAIQLIPSDRTPTHYKNIPKVLDVDALRSKRRGE